MIIRVPNDEVLKWLYPDMFIEPRCYLEVDICWDGRVYIEPFKISSLDSEWEHKFDGAERAELRRYVSLGETTNPICGRWRVDMLDWWLLGVKMPRRFWWWFRNVKVIWQNPDGSIQGCNVLWGWLKWGDFDVENSRNSGFGNRRLFRYRFFNDQVSLNGDEAEGLLWVKEWKTASFTMTRLLPEKAA